MQVPADPRRAQCAGREDAVEVAASNHGGRLQPTCAAAASFGTAQYAWMVAGAGRFGWVHPTWADRGNGREEPSHREYGGS